MHGILSDIQIEELGASMIQPFEREQIREIEDPRDPAINWAPPWQEAIPAISFGVSSHGYDLRLSAKSFRVFHNAFGIKLVDPKNFDPRLLVETPPVVDETGTWFTIPGNSYALAETIEYVRMPRDVMAICLGKSTYARCGLLQNLTPLEAGWDGIITLELANVCPAPIKVYANEGIFQAIFIRGPIWPRVTYADRAGKYMSQTGLTLARV